MKQYRFSCAITYSPVMVSVIAVGSIVGAATLRAGLLLSLSGSIVALSVAVALACVGSGRYRQAALVALLVAIGLAVGISATTRRQSQAVYTGIPVGEVRRIEGWVSRDARTGRGGGRLFLVHLERVSGVGLSASAAGAALCFGDPALIIFRGEQVATMTTLDPAPPSDRGGGDVHFFCRAGEVEHVGWRANRFRVRAALFGRLMAGIDRLPKASAALFSALFAGDRDDLSPEMRRLFQRAGAMHILALSGMHLGIFSALLFGITLPLIGRRAALISGLLLCCCYVSIVGPQPSLMRALTMVLLFGLLQLAGRPSEGINVLALSFLVLVLCFPGYIGAVSFQLSFSALAGIMLFAGDVDRVLIPWLPKPIRLPIAASVGAQMGSMPLLIIWFDALYPVGIVSSIVLTPLVTLFIWGGILFLFIAPFPLAARPVGALLELLHAAIVGSGRLFAGASPVELRTQADDLYAVVVWLCLLAAFLLLRYNRRLVHGLRLYIRHRSAAADGGHRPQETLGAKLPRR